MTKAADDLSFRRFRSSLVAKDRSLIRHYPTRGTCVTGRQGLTPANTDEFRPETLETQ